MKNLWLLFALMLVACDSRNPLIPKSGGRPYEVVVEDDCDSMIFHALDMDVEGLPQREPSFDVTMMTNNRTEDITRLARNIVRVDINPKYGKAEIRYAQNVDAKPQMRIHIVAPTTEALQKAMPVIAPQLRNLLNRAELNTAISNLKAHHQDKAQASIREMFHTEMLIPEELTASKKGKQFVWYSNQQAQGMMNICLYTYPAKDLNTEEWIMKRDSIMQVNIPGEEEGMYMTTVRNGISQERIKLKDQERLIVRGLWEMKNDMMGGPLVAHAIYDSARATVMVAEGFVYAPESKKRNKIRQLETALYTLNTQNNGK
ncbi:MAG: DUF4837 family protein [Prevotella sp.]|nr:DUF4837 family protein [Prevotella sp.]